MRPSVNGACMGGILSRRTGGMCEQWFTVIPATPYAGLRRAKSSRRGTTWCRERQRPDSAGARYPFGSENLPRRGGHPEGGYACLMGAITAKLLRPPAGERVAIAEEVEEQGQWYAATGHRRSTLIVTACQWTTFCTLSRDVKKGEAMTAPISRTYQLRRRGGGGDSWAECTDINRWRSRTTIRSSSRVRGA